MKILVAGSNRDGNDKAKESAIALLKEAGHEVFHTCEIFRSFEDSKDGDNAVTEQLKQCDVYYIVCSVDGYAGSATGLRLGMAEIYPSITPYSSHQLTNPDLVNHVQAVLSPKGLIAYLELAKL